MSTPLFYAEDLAYIHDVGFGDFATRAAPGLLDMLRRSGIERGLVVDLGCGSGIWARALLQAGYAVLGIDISTAMIDLARRKAPEATFQVASLLRVDLPPCVAVTAIGECLNYQFDQHGHSDLLALFRRIHSALQPGGLFLCDLIEPGYVGQHAVQRSYTEAADWAVLLEKCEDSQHQMTRSITIFRQVGDMYRRSSETHVAQLYPGPEMARLLRECGFRVSILRGYGDFRFRKAHVGLMARKVYSQR